MQWVIRIVATSHGHSAHAVRGFELGLSLFASPSSNPLRHHTSSSSRLPSLSLASQYLNFLQVFCVSSSFQRPAVLISPSVVSIMSLRCSSYLGPSGFATEFTNSHWPCVLAECPPLSSEYLASTHYHSVSSFEYFSIHAKSCQE